MCGGDTFAAVHRAAPFELETRTPQRLLDGRQVVRQDAEAPAHRVAGCRAACRSGRLLTYRYYCYYYYYYYYYNYYYNYYYYYYYYYYD